MNFTGISGGMPTRFEMFMLEHFGVRFDLSESNMLAIVVLCGVAVVFAKAVLPIITYR